MPLKGDLQDFSLPDLFQLIHFGKKNGTLVIANGDAMGYVCFRNGNVFFATHNWKKSPLGQRLVEAGMVAQEQIDEALKLQETTHKGQRVGNILVELGYLSRESLEVFVEEQIRDAVFNLLRWKEGDFDFDPDQIFPEEDIGLSMRTEDLIMEGSRRLDEWFKIEKKVPSLDSVFSLTEAAGSDAGGLDLTSEERLVFNHVDGDSSVRDIIARSGQSALVTCRALYGLVTAGQVLLVGESAEAEVPVEEAHPAGTEVSESSPGGGTPAEAEVSVVPEEEEPGAAQVPGDEDIDFGDSSDDGLIVEESDLETPRRAARSRRKKKKKKSEEEILLEDGGDTDFVFVVEQEAEQKDAAGHEPVAQEPVEQETVTEEAFEQKVDPATAPAAALTEEEPAGAEAEAATAEGRGGARSPDAPPETVGEVREAAEHGGAATREAAAADGAPAPGQSLVDYYKSMALKELGDSEIYRETEDRKVFIEQAERGELKREDAREFELVEAPEEEESPAADMVEPEDIPMEWAGHLTRLRGRTTRGTRGEGPDEADERGQPGAEEEAALEPYAQAADEDSVSIEEEARPAPVAEIDFGSDVMADALDAIAPQPDSTLETQPPPEPVFELELEPPSEPEPEVALEPEPEVALEPEPEVALEPEPPDVSEKQLESVVLDEETLLEEPVFSVEEEAAGEPGGLPALEEAAAFDETAVPTEDDIEKMLQVTPTSRGELSREELLAFDQPTYPILETREGPPASVEEQVAADGAAEGAGAFEKESPVPVASDDPGGPAGAPGKVIQFSRASAERDFEVVLEQPEPVVRSTAVETLAVAEDLQVPVSETVVDSEEPAAELEAAGEAEETEAPEALLQLVQETDEAPPLVEEAATAPDGRETETVYESVDGETEFILEVEGLEEPSADAGSLDLVTPLAARELELDVEPEMAAEPDATAQLEQAAEPEMVAEPDAVANLEAAELSEKRDTEAEEFAALGGEQFEDIGQDAILSGSAASGQEIASWGEQETAVPDDDETALAEEASTASAAELETEPGEALEPGLDFDHLEELREIASIDHREQPVEETMTVLDEAELEAAATDLEPELDYDTELEDEDEGLLGPMKVSGRRGAGTSLVDLETFEFELEQELLELAGSSEPKKQKLAVDRSQVEPDKGRKDRKARGTGRSRGKEVDKGSVKKIIDDLKDK